MNKSNLNVPSSTSSKKTSPSPRASSCGEFDSPSDGPRLVEVDGPPRLDQPTFNIGVIGHVAHGKSTLVKSISGVVTGKSKRERQRNMTVHLGYANAKIYRCPACEPPRCYQSFPGGALDPLCLHCDHGLVLKRHVSFVDCPGHEALMATMLNGAAAFHAAILVVAANERVAPPQTREHLAVVHALGVPHVLCVQSKVDVVSMECARAHHVDLVALLRGTAGERSPIIPVCSTGNINVDLVLQHICERFPAHPGVGGGTGWSLAAASPTSRGAPAHLDVLRSFDVNKPGTRAARLQGAVLGGTLRRGSVSIGDEVEIRPGFVRYTSSQPSNTRMAFRPMFATVVSLTSQGTPLRSAIPGGLIAIGTSMDPSLAKRNGLVGCVVGLPGTLPPVWEKVLLKARFLPRRLAACERGSAHPRAFFGGEALQLSAGASSIGARVARKRTEPPRSSKTQVLACHLDAPLCASVGQRVAISRADTHRGWHVVAVGTVQPGSLKAQLLIHDDACDANEAAAG